MFKKMILTLIAGLAVHAAADTAKAQTMADMVANELRFQNQFYNWAWQGSQDVARYHRLTGQPIPFNAATLVEANRQNQRAYDAYNAAWHNNSNRTGEVMNNYSNYNRGLGGYQGNNGQVYNLPWTHNQYHIDQYGRAVPGYNPYRENLTPYYGR